LTISCIRLHEEPAGAASGMLTLFIRDIQEGLPQVAHSMCEASESSVLTIRVNNYADANQLIHDWLQTFDLLKQELVLGIHSDCSFVSAHDAAFIASLVIPNVRIEDTSGDHLCGIVPRSAGSSSTPEACHAI